MNKQDAQQDFGRLHDTARAKNQFYYLFNLFGWVGVQRTTNFMVQVNQMTNALLLDRVRAVPPQGVPPHEALFLLQTNLEAKAFYASLRNFVSPLVGRHAKPEPWTELHGERAGKGAKLRLATSKIVDNLVDDLRNVGFDALAGEFDATHRGLGGIIRNAAAHATFLIPSPETGGSWIFGNYVANAKGFIQVEDHTVSPEEFRRFLIRLFDLRLAFMQVLDDRRLALREQTFDFSFENQMKPSEVLQCTFDKGTLKFVFQGTHVW